MLYLFPVCLPAAHLHTFPTVSGKEGARGAEHAHLQAPGKWEQKENLAQQSHDELQQ